MSKTLLTLLLGISIGILIAPAKGSETWEKLMGCLDDIKDKFEGGADDLADRAEELARGQ